MPAQPFAVCVALLLWNLGMAWRLRGHFRAAWTFIPSLTSSAT
jgi:hypothetical protein